MNFDQMEKRLILSILSQIEYFEGLIKEEEVQKQRQSIIQMYELEIKLLKTKLEQLKVVPSVQREAIFDRDGAGKYHLLVMRGKLVEEALATEI